ncbi:hypothetical protein [Mesorhizobium xinjiangense]|uniref:hypothetical protein n=1 Tax=Mesorhizobium xinjiangense TaxID=2678685 RepID=UPI0012EE0B43|nr:hypothetical protein [Mesorhizobium xinjiangense]
MKLSFLAVFAPLSLAACAATPPAVLPMFNAADPRLGPRDTHYHPVVVDYTHREPVEPEDWRRLNEQLSPSDGEVRP